MRKSRGKDERRVRRARSEAREESSSGTYERLGLVFKGSSSGVRFGKN